MTRIREGPQADRQLERATEQGQAPSQAITGMRKNNHEPRGSRSGSSAASVTSVVR